MRKIFFDKRFIELEDEASYDAFRAMFHEVNAGGGLVRNENGEYLMILRNGLWDLPKGHQEPEEDIRECARREVMEETSARHLETGDLICITDHCYFRNGEWYLKHTYWFSMKCIDKDFSPQEEEGITAVKWLDGKELDNCVQHSYSSIREVFLQVFGQK